MIPRREGRTVLMTVVLMLAAAALIFRAAGREASPRPTPDDPAAGEPAGVAEEHEPGRWVAKVEPASEEAEKAIASFDHDEGLDVTLFAAEPELANPVAFWMQPDGRCYVAESFRFDAGIPENRDHRYWIDDDIASQTVEDRAAMYLKHHPEFAEEWTVRSDRIRLLVDEDRDGRADRATVFADGFDDLLDGIGAGLLARGGDVFYTCIPNLWRLRDTDGDGVADERTSMFRGFGVRCALLGHDLHGLRMGPDRRLYFSVGDRGYNIVNHEGKHLFSPGSGAVFRCEPDGRNLEVFASWLRNPQELAFDDHGNLFTGDNNSDSDDQARLVYVVEGAMIGWRMSFQYLDRRGPWVREGWWKPRHEGQAAFLIPPVANLGNGPSGLVHYPGVGMSESFDGTFLLCDFRGSRKHSGVRTFKVRPRGAGMELTESGWLVRGLLATDVGFGGDGSVYVSDWVRAWRETGKGRIYRLRDERHGGDPLARATAELLAAGLAGRPAAELERLLGHADQRVRLEAQLELAGRGVRSVPGFVAVARGSGPRLARLHAIWGLGQLGRRRPGVLNPIVDLLDDDDPEVRAQAAKVFGEARSTLAFEALVHRLSDEEPRVRFFAAMALGKIGDPRAIAPVFAMLRDNGDDDLYLRHAGVMALTWIGDRDAVVARGADAERAVRLAALLVLRRLEDPRVAAFLDDADRLIADEAARAVYDVPIAAALTDLAERLGRPAAESEPFGRRAIGAHDILGRPRDVAALAAYAARPNAPESLRHFALTTVRDWHPAPPNDPVLNEHRERAPRSADDVRRAVAPHLDSLLGTAPDRIEAVAAQIAGRYGLADAEPRLFALAGDRDAATPTRIAALEALHALRVPSLEEAATGALTARDARLKGKAAAILADLDADLALPILARALESESTVERQLALGSLGRIGDPRADALLLARFDLLERGGLDPALELELLTAARRRAKADAAGFSERLAAWDETLADADPVTRRRESLAGGDPERGRRVFARSDVQCQRCHALDGGETEKVGPDLGDVGVRRDRRFLLESIVAPNAAIADGFHNVMIEDSAGTVFNGRLLEDSADRIRLEIEDGDERKTVTIAAADVAYRKSTASSMPEDLADKLNARDLRDVIAFLSAQRGDEPPDVPELTGTIVTVAPARGLGPQANVARRDPSDIVEAGPEWFVFYTRTEGEGAAAISCASSRDEGVSWTEHGAALRPASHEHLGHPNIAVYRSRYYLVFSSRGEDGRTSIRLASSTSPRGPWRRAPDPLLEPSDDAKAFDAASVDEPSLLRREGRFWLYYLGRGREDDVARLGLAHAWRPDARFSRHEKSPLARVHGSTLLTWPHRTGVALMQDAPGTSPISYAPDGLRFRRVGVLTPELPSPAAFRPDAFDDTRHGRGIRWGLTTSRTTPPHLLRFTCDLTAP